MIEKIEGWKKIITFLIVVAAVLFGPKLGASADQIEKIFYAGVALIGGLGMADWGKNK